ncbi:Oidioi.mRNA.OKI2018_I69.XSR.g15974.t2.cds [Oikopleura dioica]|uniref:Oidioi.mRNA.OKI2018_I69.XSR.g15974.t2.cds n=1 Tax=Oikopleura dioica TaxID=34765 RepID=A0ABN7SLX2_OIKDI|nr:Oidioi.mRNA.OKI2018_I69.XSR.g15974.t2.cds [Oikopleura dioica]
MLLALTGLKICLSVIFFVDLVSDILVVKFFFSERKCDPNYVPPNQKEAADLFPNETRLAMGIGLEWMETEARDPDEIKINYTLYGILYLIFFVASHFAQAIFSCKRWSEWTVNGECEPNTLTCHLKVAHVFLLHMIHRYFKELHFFFRLQKAKIKGKTEVITRFWNDYVNLVHDNHFLIIIEKGIEATPQVVLLLYVYVLERCRNCSEDLLAVDVPIFGKVDIIYKIAFSFLCVVLPLALSVSDEQLRPNDLRSEWSAKKKYLCSAPIYALWIVTFTGVRIICLAGMFIMHPVFSLVWLLTRVVILSVLTKKAVCSLGRTILTNLVWMTIWFEPIGAREINRPEYEKRYQQQDLLYFNYVAGTIELLISCAVFYFQGNACLAIVVNWFRWTNLGFVVALLVAHLVSIAAAFIFHRYINKKSSQAKLDEEIALEKARAQQSQEQAVLIA